MNMFAILKMYAILIKTVLFRLFFFLNIRTDFVWIFLAFVAHCMGDMSICLHDKSHIKL